MQLPDGSYLCNDDASDNVLDPELLIESPAEGQYNLWVGSYDEGQLIPGFLVITANRSVNVNNFDPGALVKRGAIGGTSSLRMCSAPRLCRLRSAGKLRRGP